MTIKITTLLMLLMTINNYWMRLSMISRIIQTSVNVICRRLRRITLTEVWIILDIMRKPNPIIVLLYIQNSHAKIQVDIFPILILQCSLRQQSQTYCKPFCYFLIFARFEIVTSSASNMFFGHLRPIIHSIRRE